MGTLYRNEPLNVLIRGSHYRESHAAIAVLFVLVKSYDLSDCVFQESALGIEQIRD